MPYWFRGRAGAKDLVVLSLRCHTRCDAPVLAPWMRQVKALRQSAREFPGYQTCAIGMEIWVTDASPQEWIALAADFPAELDRDVA